MKLLSVGSKVFNFCFQGSFKCDSKVSHGCVTGLSSVIEEEFKGSKRVTDKKMFIKLS